MELSARLALPAIALGLALGSGGPARAEAVRVDYGISLGGFPLGTADVSSTLEANRYSLQIQARLTGLAGALTGGKGAANAAGALGGGRPMPSSFAVTSRSGSDQRTVRMGLAGGNVAAVDITPPVDEKPDRVPVKEAHKRGVVDPVSAVIMPALARGDLMSPENCNRTIPVFDGAARFDVVLTFADTRTVEKPGYSGPVLVCNARYVPIAGHRTERPSTKFMQENRDMDVWLAPVPEARVLMPLRISVRTMIGTSVIEASRIVVDSSERAPRPQRRAQVE
jgi:hypothetical protein